MLCNLAQLKAAFLLSGGPESGPGAHVAFRDGSALAEEGLREARCGGPSFTLGSLAAHGRGPPKPGRGAWVGHGSSYREGGLNGNLPSGQFFFFQNKHVGYNRSGFIAEENSTCLIPCQHW